MSEEHKNCKYRFKGKSCEDCPLNCKLKRLQKENEELREEKDGMQIVIGNYIEHTTEYRQALEEIREIVSGNYETLDPQAKQDIKKTIDEVLNDRD